MAFKASSSVLLRNREKRIFQKDFLLFWDFLNLYVSVGYDLAYAWPEVLRFLILDQKKESLKILKLTPSESSLSQLLIRLESDFLPETYRFMFTALKQLYAKGAPLTPALLAFSRFLRREIEQDFEKHLRDSPTRANLCLLVFFLPPTLVLLFFPLLTYFQNLW